MKPVISVLMSVYNESEEEIFEAVNSILEQTFKNFEFIIINDNPASERMNLLCKKLDTLDERIVIHENSENIGLAMSMNKAATLAQGDFFARMDADDVSYPTRFQKEYDVLNEGKFDVVCCRKDSGEDIKHIKKYVRRSDELTEIISPISTSICHPSVMMSRHIFEKANGYRNFPCAQDIDMWYRLYDLHAVFCIINEALIFYRVRANSISAKFIKQEITAEYIKNCFIERLRSGNDSFSESKYKSYLDQYLGSFGENKENIGKIQSVLLRANIYFANGNKLKSRLIKLRCMFQNATYRHIILKKFSNKKKIRALVKSRN